MVIWWACQPYDMTTIINYESNGSRKRIVYHYYRTNNFKSCSKGHLQIFWDKKTTDGYNFRKIGSFFEKKKTSISLTYTCCSLWVCLLPLCVCVCVCVSVFTHGEWKLESRLSYRYPLPGNVETQILYPFFAEIYRGYP